LSRIVILTLEARPYPGGIATYVHDVARAMVEQGHDVALWVFGNYGEVPEAPGGMSVKLLTRGHFSVRRLPWMTIVALREALRTQFDYWIAADFASITILGLLPVRGQKIGVLHGTEIRGALFSLFNRLRLYRPLARMDRVVANSHFTRDLALKHHPYLSEEKTIAAPLGVHAQWFVQPPDNACKSILAQLGIERGRKIVVSVGRIEERKGIEFGIGAVQLVPARWRSKLTYLIVGRVVDPAYEQSLAQKIEAGDADVRLIGPVSEEVLQALYASAFLMLHCSVPQPVSVEGFGLVLVEAAANGLPIVASDTDAISEVVRDGVTGILTPPGDSSAMSQAIVQLLDGDMPYADMKVEAVTHARCFTWKKHVVQMLGK